jgi:YidC/Oxa1 family membrane protein insertase
MNSSGSRVLLAVVISLGILIGWQFFFAKSNPPQQGSGSGSGSTVGAGSAEAPASQPASQPSSMPASRPGVRGGEARSAEGGPRAGRTAGTLTTLSRPRFAGTFTSVGGALRRWVLTNPRLQEVRDGKLQPVDLVRTADGGPYPLAATFPGSDFQLPPDALFKLVSQSADELRYRWESAKVVVDRHYVIDKSQPMVWLTIEVHNRTSAKLRGRLALSLFNQQPAAEQGKSSFTNPYPVVRMVSCYANGEVSRRSPSAIAGTESGCSAGGCGMGSGPVSKTGDVLWVASDDRYFIAALVPQDRTDARRCELKLHDGNLIEGTLTYPEATLEPGGKLTRRFSVYLGPKDLDSLDAVKGAASSDIHLSDSIEFGWFAILCRPMLWLMKIFYRAFHNWGIAIILLTIVVKLLTLYWTQKSMRSMKEMAKLKPKMDALRQKYGDDKQRLNQEMMALYKLHKVNPLGGCLPMLIQMPIWFALYRTLGNAVELYREGFVGWVHDLTAPDPYYVLPIAMGIAMYGQQAITPQPMEGTQAKVMKYFMPGLFTVMMLALPAGLTLYIFVNTILTMIHQWYMNKTDPPAPQPVAKSKPAEPPKGQPQQRKRRKTRG